MEARPASANPTLGNSTERGVIDPGWTRIEVNQNSVFNPQDGWEYHGWLCRTYKRDVDLAREVEHKR